jgi:hypothetical protein
MPTVAAPAAPVLDIHRIVYASAATHPCSDEDLEQLLITSRTNNAIAGITGMLVHHEQSFVQLIEGSASALNLLFAKLRVDPRHHKVILLLRERIAARSFPDWAMGFAHMSTEELKTIPGMNDFFARRTALATLTPSRAIKFLMAFKSDGFHSSEGLRTFLGVAES